MSQPAHRLSPADELTRRMRGPQRHRLLHGYPLAAAVPDATNFAPEHDAAFARSDRALIVGVPPHFLKGKARLLDLMRDTLGARQYRLSMGVQTFDESRLKEMGRAAFGNADTFREVVELGHKLGFTTSADLLFNLPGQSLDEM